MQETDIEIFAPGSRSDWRKWLVKNHADRQSVWVLSHKKKLNLPTVTWTDLVEEALCFGWIDSKRISLDGDRFQQFFCKRKPKSVWSKINKAKTKYLISEGLMMPAGLKAIAVARKNGSWTFLNEVEKLKIPPDLTTAFRKHPGSGPFFKSLSISKKKAMLHWILAAKRPETRQKRIEEIAELAAQKLKPKQF